MGHCITALIGTPLILAGLMERFGSPVATALPFGLVIMPLNHKRLDVLALSEVPAFEGFTYLTPDMASAIAGAIEGPALYIETDFFGGMGQQGAALFEDGQLVWQGTFSTFNDDRPETTPISRGLERLGVKAGDRDAFDAVGLVRFRDLESLGVAWDEN